LDSDNSTVAVTYEVILIQGDQVKDWFVNSHVMRFFFKNELIPKIEYQQAASFEARGDRLQSMPYTLMPISPKRRA